MARDSVVSQQLKTLHEELSASQKERAASTVAGDAPENMAEPVAKPQEGNKLHDQLRQLMDELKSLFDGVDKSISAHPTQSLVGTLLVGILIGRLLGRR
jgi:ElaB/YqjD/DUF883 family membrane-anchored ribosome-binding protein